MPITCTYAEAYPASALRAIWTLPPSCASTVADDASLEITFPTSATRVPSNEATSLPHRDHSPASCFCVAAIVILQFLLI